MTARCDIDVRFFPPPPELRDCFSTFYRATFTMCEGDRVRDRLQPEWANLRFFSGDVPEARVSGGSERWLRARFTATGPSALSTEFQIGTTRMWGVGLFPLGWAKFICLPASGLANAVVDGEAHPAYARFAHLPQILFDGEADDEREYRRIIDCFLELNRPHPDEERIMAVHRALVDPTLRSVGELVERSGVNARTLERLCHRAFGFSPKILLRRQRVMRSLAAFMLGKGGNWSDAIDHHYHDQAHFVRDFRAFMGMSPREYAALDHPILTAFMPERARIWGSPAQTLDKPSA